MSDVKFEPLRKCPGLDGKGCSTLFDGSRGELCTACADQAPWLNPNHRRGTGQKASRRPIPVSEQAVASRDGSNPRDGQMSSGASRPSRGLANHLKSNRKEGNRP